jgi:hypothetical protein
MKRGFNTFAFLDNGEIICLEIPTKNFKARVWKEQGKLYLENEVIDMNVHVKSIEDVLALLKDFDGIYEKIRQT